MVGGQFLGSRTEDVGAELQSRNLTHGFRSTFQRPVTALAAPFEPSTQPPSPSSAALPTCTSLFSVTHVSPILLPPPPFLDITERDKCGVEWGSSAEACAGACHCMPFGHR